MTDVLAPTAPTAAAPQGDAPRRRLPRWVLAVPVLLLAMAIAIAVALTSDREPDAIDRALDLARDGSAFETATDGGTAFTRISIVLQDGGEACVEGTTPTSCDHLFAASAHARVSAVSLLSCTKRGVLEARASMERYLLALDASPTAPMPPIPACAPPSTDREEPSS